MNPKNFSAIIFFILTTIVLACSSCQKVEDRRVYDEIILESPLKSMEAMPPDHQQVMKEGMGNLPPMMGQPSAEMPAAAMPAAMSDMPLKWKTPSGWAEQKGSGMRLVTFTAGATNDKIECSIVSLGGQAGGMKANIVRWLGQVKIPVPSDEDLGKFIDQQEDFESHGHFKGKLLDFTQLQEKAPAATPSMMAAIVETASAQVFVKMTGNKSALSKNKTLFKNLCLSLELK